MAETRYSCVMLALKLLKHIKAAQAEPQPPGEQGQGERPAGTYDDWALSAYTVAGPHLALYRTNPNLDTQVWLFVLTSPYAPRSTDTAASEAEIERLTVHLFFSEDALNLELGLDMPNDTAFKSRAMVNFCCVKHPYTVYLLHSVSHG